jgi:hypothetical protein
MATEHLTIVKSDLSGDTEAATITFGLGGTWYEIDLTKAEEEQLQKSLKTYLKAGRKATPKQPEKRKVVPETTAEQREQIRAWARSEGFEVPERGRIPKEIVAAWNEAHPQDAVK